MMEYAIFKEVVKEQILEHLPEEFKGSTVDVHEVSKVNQVLDGLTVLKPSRNSAPTVYINHLYEDYMSGKSIQECLVHCADMIADAYKDLEELMPRVEESEMKENVIMTLVNKEQNKEMLEKIPHRDFQDLVVVYRWVVDISKEGIASTIVNNHLMERAGMTEQDLFQLAVENTKRLLPPRLESMLDVLMGSVPKEVVDMTLAEIDVDEIRDTPEMAMYVLSNSVGVNGAVSMLYEDNLHKLAQKLGSDLYILPSSVHESILVSTKMGDPNALAQMVQDINMSQVELSDRLSNNVYHYDKDLRKVTLATNTPNKRLDGKIAEPPMVYETEKSR